MMKNILLILILISFSIGGFTQEILTGLQVNPVIKNFKNLPAKKTKGGSLVRDTLLLPFVDDFSKNTVFPDQNLWIDKFAFININYPIHPVTIGVATLDALDDRGKLYTNASSQDTFVADHLTSKPINLTVDSSGKTSIGVKDSVYLSFYFQPGGGLGGQLTGYGTPPDVNDLIMLEFANPVPYTEIKWDSIKTIQDTLFDRVDTTKIDFIYTTSDTINKRDTLIQRWDSIWSFHGMTLDSFYVKYKTYFKLEMIPIKDSVYFYNGFQFRFKNYSRLYNGIEPGWASGNVSQWNLDYVYLNDKRTKSDTNFRDAAFIQQNPSMIKGYQAMPWRHFLANAAGLMIDTLGFPVTNLFNVDSANVQMNLSITELSDTANTYSTIKENKNIQHNDTYRFEPAINYVFKSTQKDSAAFDVIASIEVKPDFIASNNSSTFVQKFYNYYAYDDGIPENGYGYNGQASIAYRFTNYLSDTLRAIQMYFNQTLDSSNIVDFNLTVWNDNKGTPGNIIYQQTNVVPVLEDSLNQYHTYRIDDTALIIGAGYFYVGWTQSSATGILNVGFDRDNNEQQNLFVNFQPSIYAGALMIRPVFGKKIPIVQTVHELNQQKFPCKIYPNPVHDGLLQIDFNNVDNTQKQISVEIFDLLGNKTYSSDYNKTIDVSGLSNGIYFVRITDRVNNSSVVNKLIISK